MASGWPQGMSKVVFVTLARPCTGRAWDVAQALGLASIRVDMAFATMLYFIDTKRISVRSEELSMVERICPQCQHGNPLENRFCGACGSSLERQELATRHVASLTIAGRPLPIRQMRQVGSAMALSLAAVAAEAGLAWLKRRAEQGVQPQATQPLARSAPQQVVPNAGPASVVTIISQRVTEIWDQGSLTRQVVEKHIWRKEGDG